VSLVIPVSRRKIEVIQDLLLLPFCSAELKYLNNLLTDLLTDPRLWVGSQNRHKIIAIAISFKNWFQRPVLLSSCLLRLVKKAVITNPSALLNSIHYSIYFRLISTSPASKTISLKRNRATAR